MCDAPHATQPPAQAESDKTEAQVACIIKCNSVLGDCALPPPRATSPTTRVLGRCGVCPFRFGSPTCDTPHTTQLLAPPHPTANPVLAMVLHTACFNTQPPPSASDCPPNPPLPHLLPLLTTRVPGRCGVCPFRFDSPTCDTPHATQPTAGPPTTHPPTLAMALHTACVTPPPPCTHTHPLTHHSCPGKVRRMSFSPV